MDIYVEQPTFICTELPDIVNRLYYVTLILILNTLPNTCMYTRKKKGFAFFTVVHVVTCEQ